MIGIHSRMALLFLLLSTVISSACLECESVHRNGELTDRESALVALLHREVPTATKNHLQWHTICDIIHSLRHSIRFRKYADLFSGSAGMSSAFNKCSMRSGVSLDLDLGGIAHDICDPARFALYIQYALELVPMALATIGLPCSSFVFMSRGTSKRYPWNSFLGDQ